MSPSDPSRAGDRHVSRRRLLGAAAGAAVGLGLGRALRSADVDLSTIRPAVTHGRVRQSIVNWCFRKHWDLRTLCGVARALGVRSVELLPPSEWPVLKEFGLTCAIAGSHGFEKGMNHPAHHEECIAKLRASIDASADFGCPSVITFTGFAGDVSPADGIDHCVAGFKKIVGHAEEKGIDLCLEMLNSRVDETMKGHPGYQGDHVDYCMEIIRRVGSPRMKLLFDIYHVQIMDGDVTRRLIECADSIGHIHTAGNPGRRELDDQQEIQYPPILRALVATGYRGFVGQEFIPTRDPLEGLREAVALCDV